MNKDVIVTENSVEIIPIRLRVRYDDNGFEIVFQGNTNLIVDGDFYLGATGEMGLMSKNNNIHLDGINGKIHLNSRISKPLKDLPESIKFREKKERERKEAQKRLEEHQQHKHDFENDVLEMIGDIRKRIDGIEGMIDKGRVSI